MKSQFRCLKMLVQLAPTSRSSFYVPSPESLGRLMVLCVAMAHSLHCDLSSILQQPSFWAVSSLEGTMLKYFCLFVWDGASLCSPGWSGTCHIDQAALRIRDHPPVSALKILGMEVVWHHLPACRSVVTVLSVPAASWGLPPSLSSVLCSWESVVMAGIHSSGKPYKVRSQEEGGHV